MIKCEKCGANTKVVDTRHKEDEVYRKRVCECGNYTYTVEFTIDEDDNFKQMWSSIYRRNNKRGD